MGKSLEFISVENENLSEFNAHVKKRKTSTLLGESTLDESNFI